MQALTWSVLVAIRFCLLRVRVVFIKQPLAKTLFEEIVSVIQVVSYSKIAVTTILTLVLTYMNMLKFRPILTANIYRKRSHFYNDHFSVGYFKFGLKV